MKMPQSGAALMELIGAVARRLGLPRPITHHDLEREKTKGKNRRRKAKGKRRRKMGAAAAIVSFLFFCLPAANAGGRTRFARVAAPFTFLGKNIGRTFGGFLTWRDPARNLAYLGYAASIAMDLHSTAHFVAKCPYCVEITNPLLPDRPGTLALALDGAGEFFLATSLSTSILENRHIPLPFKFVPYAALGTVAAMHVEAARHNYSLPLSIQPAQPARRLQKEGHTYE